jgi:microcystin-dependent protein
MLGGIVSFAVAGATTVALSGPSGSITPGAGPTQQQNLILRFAGNATGTPTYQFSLPGLYVVDNQATGAFPIVLAPASGTGTQIGAPPGVKTPIIFDGSNVDFVNAPLPGTPIDLHGATSIPAWMTACTKQYALIKDGATYSTASYAQLAAQLGSTFGGNGITTFGVPDERARQRLALDTGATGRVTAAGSGINATVMGAAGGDQLLQSHTHTTTEAAHTHSQDTINAGAVAYGVSGGSAGSFGIFNNFPGPPNKTATTGGAVTGLTINNAGTGGSANMPPTIVSFLALIKT